MFLCDEYFLLFWFRLQAEANLPSPRVKLAGLDPAALYTDESTGYSYTGGELMYRGLFLPQPEGDYVSQMLLFHRQ
ncbi:MAG: GH36 C-terminal domain-containing protein [Spirochaetota bacterium]